MDVLEDTMAVAEKAALQGGLTGLSTALLHGSNRGIVTPMGTYPAWAVTAGIGAGSSLLNDVLHKYVFKEIPVKVGRIKGWIWAQE